MAFDRVGDADASDQQGREANQREKLREAADGALQLRRSIAAAANLPACFRQCGSRIIRQRGRGTVVGRAVRQPDTLNPPRKVATTDTCPRERRNATSCGLASRWINENARSPPSRVRPSRASPSLRLAATEPTPAIAITPSAIQPMKT